MKGNESYKVKIFRSIIDIKTTHAPQIGPKICKLLQIISQISFSPILWSSFRFNFSWLTKFPLKVSNFCVFLLKKIPTNHKSFFHPIKNSTSTQKMRLNEVLTHLHVHTRSQPDKRQLPPQRNVKPLSHSKWIIFDEIFSNFFVCER